MTRRAPWLVLLVNVGAGPDVPPLRLPADSPACPPAPPRSTGDPVSLDHRVAPAGNACARSLGGRCVPMAAAGMPSPRHAATTVWTGDRLIVWGGYSDVPPTSRELPDGAIFDPQANAWTPIATEGAPPLGGTALWSGRELLVWHSAGNGPQHQITAYDPVARRWRAAGTSPMPSLRRGDKIYGFYRTGNEDMPHPPSFVFDPATGVKRDLPRSPLSRRDGYETVYTGDQLVVWGGRRDGDLADLRDGARFDFASEKWRRLSARGAPSARHSFSMVWDGERVLVLGGWKGHARLPAGDGAAYDPATDRWSPLGDRDPERVPARILVADGSRIRYVQPFDPARLGPSVLGDLALPRPRLAWQDKGGCEAKLTLIGFAPGELWVTVDDRVARLRDGAFAPLDVFDGPRDGVSYVWTGTALLAWGGRRDVPTQRKDTCGTGEEGGGAVPCDVVEVTHFSDGVIVRP